MSRPLVINVKEQRSSSNLKLDTRPVQKLKVVKVRTKYICDEVDRNDKLVKHENKPEQHQSLVRKLISKYETTTKSTNLLKTKSKSLVDFPKPKTTVLGFDQTTQDDFLYDRSQFDNDSSTKIFPVKDTVSKFETIKISPNYKKPENTRSYHTLHRKSLTENIIDFNKIKQQARELVTKLKQVETSEDDEAYFAWQDEVVELLLKIGCISDAGFQREHESENQPSDTQQVDVNDNTNLFSEAKENGCSAQMPNEEGNKLGPIRRFVRSFSEVGKSIEKFESLASESVNEEVKSPYKKTGRLNSEKDSQKVGVAPVILQEMENNDWKVVEVSHKVRALKNIFEQKYEPAVETVVKMDVEKYMPLKNFFHQTCKTDSEVMEENCTAKQHEKTNEDVIILENGVHIIHNRMLPAAKSVILDDPEVTREEEIANSRKQIEEIFNEIKEYEERIVNIAEGDVENDLYSFINEMLVRTTIKVSNLETFGDEHLQKERVRCCEYAKRCIEHLKEKVGESRED